MGNNKAIKRRTLFKGKLCAIALSASIAAGCVTLGALQLGASGAESIEDLEAKAEQIKKDNEDRKALIDSYGDDIDKNEAAMELVDKQIDGVNDEIDAYSKLITAKQEEIDRKLIDIYKVEQDIDDREREISDKKIVISALQAENKLNLEKFGKLARYMYMNNTSSQIPVLSGSDDWSTYFLYSTVVNNISSQNYDFMKKLEASIEQQKQLIEELNGEVAALETEKEKLEAKKEEYEAEAEKLENKKAELESDAEEKRNYLYSLAADNESMKGKIKDLNDEIAAANAEREALNEQIEELIRQMQQAAQDSADYFDYSGGPLGWPVSPTYNMITTYFGYDAWRNGMHRGIDIAGGGIHGANVYAAQSGTVISVVGGCSHDFGKGYSCGCGGGYGNYLIIDHGGGLSTLYAHCSAIYVSAGQFVNQGDVIASVGSTGWSTGPHMHFETRENGVAVNPFNYVSN